MPAAAGLTFYTAYTARAKALFTAGTIAKDSVFEAIMYDMKNLDTNAAIDRLQAKASGIATAAVVGVGLKYAKDYIDPKLRMPMDMIGDALIGMSIGSGFKALLDPPIENSPAPTRKIASGSSHSYTQESPALSLSPSPAQTDRYVPFSLGA